MKLPSDNFSGDSQSHPQRLAWASTFLLLLPVLVPCPFSPLSGAFPSLFSEWNAPKPMHFRLLDGALERQTSVQQQKSLWSPLANQGWRPCLDIEAPRDVPVSVKKSGYIQVFLDGGLNQQKMGLLLRKF